VVIGESTFAITGRSGTPGKARMADWPDRRPWSRFVLGIK